MKPPPAAFISYSHDTPQHKSWVLNFATRLRQSGVDAILDQWDLGPGSDLPHFMEQSISRSARIIMICTDRYVVKANAGVGGVGYEKMIVTYDLMQRIGTNKVIPIVRQSGPATLPTFLQTKLYVDLSRDDDFETGFDQVLRELVGAPIFAKPPIGSTPFKPAPEYVPTTAPEPVAMLMLLITELYDSTSYFGSIKVQTVREFWSATKLLFDYAADIACEQELIERSPDRTVFTVTEKGRKYMLQRSFIEAGSPRGAA